MTLAEFTEVSDAYEYAEQKKLAYHRHFAYCIVAASGAKIKHPKQLLPLPLIDEADGGFDLNKILNKARELKQRRAANGSK